MFVHCTVHVHCYTDSIQCSKVSRQQILKLFYKSLMCPYSVLCISSLIGIKEHKACNGVQIFNWPRDGSQASYCSFRTASSDIAGPLHDQHYGFGGYCQTTGTTIEASLSRLCTIFRTEIFDIWACVHRELNENQISSFYQNRCARLSCPLDKRQIITPYHFLQISNRNLLT